MRATEFFPFSLILCQLPFWSLLLLLFSCSVAQSCLTLWDPMDCSMPGFPVLSLSEFLKLKSIESGCHPTISSSVVPFSCCLQSFPGSGSFGVSSSHKVAKVLSFSFSISPSNKYSGLISFRIDWFDLHAVPRTLKSSPAPQFESINSLALSLLYCSTPFFFLLFNSYISKWLLEKP